MDRVSRQMTFFSPCFRSSLAAVGLMCGLLLSGCQQSTDSGTASGPAPASGTSPAAAPTPDDAVAVQSLTDAGFALQKNSANNVTEASLNLESENGEALAGLAGLPSLQVLRLSGPSMTDSGMEVLAKLSGLRRLDLSDSAISDETLKHISGLQNLEALF
ncbi:MAG: hypothetical protein KDA89_00405, partial [Planctomycetaceae bacterium]|nr:hypothetical protein [Planctomycetaceae bacterium]